MAGEPLYSDELQVKHILKADPFGQAIVVYNKDKNNKEIDLVEDVEDFFSHIYVDASGKLNINGINSNQTIDDWLSGEKIFRDSLNCWLFFIEGYAGCGKSTLVQHILYTVLDNPNYEYSYYNYDVGTFPEDDLQNQDNSIDFIKYSILHGLKDQIVVILDKREGRDILDKFLFLISDDEAVQKLDRTLRIKKKFGINFVSAAEAILNNHDRHNKDKKIDALKMIMEEQLDQLSTYQLLCVDYLWRLSQCLVDFNTYRKYMCVCYDNLDSIMNYDLLCGFKDQLITFRDNVNEYILKVNNNIRIKKKTYGKNVNKIGVFVIFATFRKITAIRATNRNTEMLDDIILNEKYVKVIEVSKQYKFTQIAQKRIDHFSTKLKTINICGKNTDKLIDQMKAVDELKKMTFVKNTYSGLWNNNFRSCSNVLSDLIIYYNIEISKCIELCKQNIDGKDKYSYYGASSLFLYTICKLLKKIGIFDSNHLDLINIKEDTQKRKTSLSRLIITYIYTKNKSVSIKEIFNVFDKVFSPRYICKILGQLMTRVEGEIWRRPIYYSKNAIDNENDIENKLYSQYEKYMHNEAYSYVEFKICECGQTYITSIVPHFEFYSIRINEEYQNLYCVENSEQLKTILQNVYEKIEVCCNKQIEFAKEYITKYRIDKATYLSLKFHPRTLSMNPQLHIERVIFSHIEYFNRYRLFLISKEKPDIYDEFNEILLEYISLYLELYNEYVSEISSDRNRVVKKLKKKLEQAESGNKYISIEAQ